MRLFVGVCVVTAFAFTPGHLPAQQKKEAKPAASAKAGKKKRPEDDFLRLRRDGRRLMAMETNVVRYQNSEKYPDTTVDLIGAIHLGDPEYYDQLNKIFATYDALLYEAVKDENAEIGQRKDQPGGKRDLSGDTSVGLAVISTLQLGMKDVLGLEYQLQGVDYSRKNFVHADMTTQEFQRSMKSRGESFGGMFVKQMGKAIQQGNNANPLAQNLDMMLSMLSSDREIRMRRIMADQLVKAGAADSFGDADGESSIITERNKKALAVLTEQLGKGTKKIGIFYGAAHMPDMEKRLLEEFKYKRGDVKWLPAWKLTRKFEPAKTDPVSKKK